MKDVMLELQVILTRIMNTNEHKETQNKLKSEDDGTL